MAGKVPRKPRVGKGPLAPMAAVPPMVAAQAPLSETSAVAIAAAEMPVVEPVSVAVAQKAPSAKPAPQVAVPAGAGASQPEPAAPPVIETPAEAPVTPTPESPAVAEAAPAASEAAAPAAETKTIAPEPESVAAVQRDITMETIENTTAKAETMFADMNSRAKTALEKTQKIAGEMGDFHKGNFEAVVESAKIYAKGVEAMGQDAAEYGRRSFEQMTAALKSMAQVKTPAELLKLHADYVRSSFDAAVAEGSKTTEAVIKLAGDVAQPVSSRFAVVAEKVKTAA